MATVDWTDSEKVIMDSLLQIGSAYISLQKDLRALAAEMDDIGTQPWKSMLQDIIDKYTDLPNE